MQPAYASIRAKVVDGVATITLDRPPLNILNVTMLRELDTALDAASTEPRLKALVLCAEGRAFCAGVDVADHVPDRVDDMIRAFGQFFMRLRTFPVPTIAVVQGAALGGGTELALGCDLVLAGRSAGFGQPEIKLGVFPPIAAAVLPHLIGSQQAARLVLTGEPISADEAARIGLVTQTVADEEVAANLANLLGLMRGFSAPVLRFAKQALLLGADLGAAQALEPIESLYLGELMRTADALEGIQSFMEKRPPVWRNE
jgi:cyclohexa-1,5-dienecarbonyl-CoA hydratase